MSLTDTTPFPAPFAKAKKRPAAGQRSREEIQAWLVDRLAKHLSVSPQEIDIERSFASYGLGSMTAVKLSGELETYLGRQLSPTLTWDHPTIAHVVAHVSGTSE